MKKGARYSVLMLLLLAISLRLFKLGFHNLWFDEATSVFTTLPGFNLARFIADFNPPLYYLLLKLWVHWTGYSEFMLRFPSIVSNIISIFLLYKIGRKYFDDKVGRLAAFIMAIAPLHLWYSQEVRGYTLYTLLILVMVYFLGLAIEKDHWRDWLIFTTASLMAIFVSYISFVALLATLFFLRKTKDRMFTWLFCTSSTVIIFILIWGHVFFRRLLDARVNFWASYSSFSSIRIMLDNFNLGYNGNSITYPLILVLSIVILLYSFLRKKLSAEQLNLLYFLLFSLTIMFLLSTAMPIYIPRSMLAFSPFYYLFIARGVRNITLSWMRIFIIAVYIIMTCLALIAYYNDDIADQAHHEGVILKKPVKPISVYLKNHVATDDIIIYTAIDIMFPCWYYLWEHYPVAYYFSSDHEDNYWKSIISSNEKLRNHFASEVIFLHSIDDLKGLKFKQAWVVSSSWERTGSLNSNSIRTLELMDTLYTKISQKRINGITISLYTLK